MSEAETRVETRAKARLPTDLRMTFRFFLTNHNPALLV